MFLDNFDFVLLVAMGVDLLWKNRKINKVKKQMRKYKRYQSNTTTLKYGLYSIILGLSLLYFIFRIYILIISNGTYVFNKIFVLIPLIDYYVLFDWFLGGIYYNKFSIYYKSEYYEFKRARYIYRELVKNHYEYEINYRVPKSGDRTFTMRIPNEKEAFDLLATIPFKEYDERSMNK